ncbi:MAG: ArsR/SmtB family transcription factor [Planctomycetota bacterium]
MTTPNRRFKNAIYEQFARIGKAVSSAKRLELLDLLCQCERTVESLASETGMTVANTSRHLQVLRAARLVDAEQEGVYVTYRLTDDAVGEFFRNMRSLAERRLAEIERITRHFLEGREGLEPVDRDALLERVREGEATVLDVRPAEEHRAGHIPGAVSIPLKELEDRLSELPRGQEIVAYCRGPYCVLAIRAVEMLRAKGFRAVRLEDGVQDWRARGFPVARGEERRDRAGSRVTAPPQGNGPTWR